MSQMSHVQTKHLVFPKKPAPVGSPMLVSAISSHGHFGQRPCGHPCRFPPLLLLIWSLRIPWTLSTTSESTTSSPLQLLPPLVSPWWKGRFVKSDHVPPLMNNLQWLLVFLRVNQSPHADSQGPLFLVTFPPPSSSRLALLPLASHCPPHTKPFRFLLISFPDVIICSICIWQVVFLTPGTSPTSPRNVSSRG